MMTDTQWPRYEVFKQDTPKKRHEAVGSVHAPDAELALQNARDVFVRRPSAVSLWVVPANAILMVTREELAANPDLLRDDEGSGGEERPLRPRSVQAYHIFTKTNQRRSMTYVQHVGTLEAPTTKGALQQALQNDMFDSNSVWVWWVVPEDQIIRSENEDIDSLFAPAIDKTYRQQTYYGFVSPRRQKRGRQDK